MNMIDSHCHIQFDAYDDDRSAVVSSCAEKKIGLIVVGCDEKSSRDAIALAEKMGSGSVSRSESVPDPIFSWCSVGQHPTDSGEPFNYKTFYDLARSSKKVRAIGECGLDYYRITNQESRIKEEQKDLFYQHLNLSHELNLPLIIHCRNAHDDMIETLAHRFVEMGSGAGERGQAQILQSQKLSQTPTAPDPISREHGVLHCFTGTVRDAQSYLDLGFMISFTGIITFTNQYDEVVRTVPLEKMLVETDAPFLTPVPHRGKRNSPEYVEYIAKRIAELKEVSYEEVCSVTTKNAKRFFQF